MISASNTTLVFDLFNQSEALAYSNLILGLNSNGVTYSTSNKGCTVTITIGRGF